MLPSAFVPLTAMKTESVMKRVWYRYASHDEICGKRCKNCINACKSLQASPTSDEIDRRLTKEESLAEECNCNVCNIDTLFSEIRG